MSEAILSAPPIVETPARKGVFSALGGATDFVRCSVQGACSGMLTLAGATQLTATGLSGDLALSAAAPSLNSLGNQLVMGNVTGLLQIVGAAALFLSAGRGLGRVLGLLFFFGAAIAYFNGVAPSEILSYAQEIWRAVGPAIEAFQVALMNE